MTLYVNRWITAAGLALALAFVPAHAASDNDKSDRAKQKAAERSAAPEKKTVRQDFASCRRDARDLDGPERARFMTKCLHDRH
jgi:hypothetical protein